MSFRQTLEKTQETAVTVADLRAMLENLPGDLEIALEGCDCLGDCAGLVIRQYSHNDSPWVALVRSNGMILDGYDRWEPGVSDKGFDEELARNKARR